MFCPNLECPDLVEGGVRGEYVEGISVCPRCGAGLVEAAGLDLTEALRGLEGDVDLESIFVTADGTEAAVVRTLLAASGISFTTTGDADQEYLGLGWAGVGVVGRGGISFMVRSEDAAAAKELLNQRELVEDQEV
jgi:hypothetical protein